MVEVFKTTVADANAAKKLLDQIHAHFKAYHANFDLEDCDRILRIKSSNDTVCASAIISLVEKNGYAAEVLEDLEVDLNRI